MQEYSNKIGLSRALVMRACVCGFPKVFYENLVLTIKRYAPKAVFCSEATMFILLLFLFNSGTAQTAPAISITEKQESPTIRWVSQFPPATTDKDKRKLSQQILDWTLGKKNQL